MERRRGMGQCRISPQGTIIIYLHFNNILKILRVYNVKSDYLYHTYKYFYDSFTFSTTHLLLCSLSGRYIERET